MKAFVVLALLALAAARPEPPPAPGYSTTRQDFMAPPYDAPSTSYGPPSSDYSAPDSLSYNAPSPQYRPPAQNRGFSAPSSRYSAPSRASSRAPSPSAVYGAPGVTAALFRSAPPSTNYGAPAPSSNFGAPSSLYGPPGYDSARARLAQDDLSEPANYEFQYAVEDYEFGANFGHQEQRQDNSARGEYRVLLPDGRTQIVQYEADEEGYRPVIRYEETGGPYAASQGNQGGPY